MNQRVQKGPSDFGALGLGWFPWFAEQGLAEAGRIVGILKMARPNAGRDSIKAILRAASH